MRGSNRSPLVTLPVALLAALASLRCEQIVVTTIGVHRVDISPPTAFVKINETIPLTVTVLSRDGRTLSGRTIAWASLNPDIATVDETGVVRGLTPGSATINATTEGALGSANVIVMSGPAIAAAPQEVEFTAVQNGATPGDRAVNVTNVGDGTLSGLTATIAYSPGEPTGWLAAYVSGTAPTTLVLSASQAGLTLGTYTATIALASSIASNSPMYVTVRLTVLAPQPAIALGATTLSFAAAPGGADPAQQSIGVTNAGGGTLSGLSQSVSYTEGEPTGWLTAALAATSAPTTLTLTPRVGSLAVGTYNATVRIAASSASNTPVDITVAFTIAAAPPVPPAAPAATAVSDRRINVSWTDRSDNESRFDVERSNNGLTGWTVIGSPGANQNTYADSIGLTGSSTYYYRVSACNAIACSPNVTVVSATTAPNAPTNLATTAAASSRVDLTWNDNSTDETGFPIERSSNGGQTWTVISTAAANAQSYSDVSAAPATTYRYRARACRTAVCSRYSNESQATTGMAPAAPSALAAATTSPTRIDLTWTDNSTNETQFRIEARTDAGTFTQVGTAAANTESFSHTALSPKTLYFYRVRACTAAECSSYSTETSATTPPNAPTGLAASAASHAQVNLTWTAPPEPVAGYSIERRVGTAAFAPLANVTGANTTTYADNNVQATTAYTYRVKACDNTLCSAFSNNAPVTTPAAPLPPPGAPTGLTANAASSDRIDLAWSASSGTVGRYRIERKNNTLLGAYAVVDSVPAGTLAFQSSGLTPAMSYSHRVQACNSAGCSDYSNEATMSTPAITIVTGPTNLVATGISATQIDLTWDYEGLLLLGSFEIERAPNSAPSNFTLIETVSGSARTYPDAGLTTGTYHYRVRACNHTGCSAWSSAATASTLTPATPTNVTAVATSASQITVSWTAPGGQTSYLIRRRVDGKGQPTTITVSDPSATAYADGSLSAKTRYTYEVRACGADGACSSYSAQVSATTF